MGRQKKFKSVQEEIKTEVIMETHEETEKLQQEIDILRKNLEEAKKEIAEKKFNREVSEDEKQIIINQTANIKNKEHYARKIAEKKARDSVIVRGKFINRHLRGQAVKLPYIKYDTDPVKWWPFEDGKIYEIPKGFADQINGGTETDPCYYKPVFTQKQGIMDTENPESAIQSVDSSVKKYAFVPVDF
jgi:hypothetical protein